MAPGEAVEDEAEQQRPWDAERKVIVTQTLRELLRCVVPLPTAVNAELKADVRRAYLRFAKEMHPDRGGDGVAFKRASDAYSDWIAAVEQVGF